jgi:hypothetical protein
MFMTSGGDLLIVASKQRELPRPDWSVMQYPDVAADLCPFLPITPQTLEATRSGGRLAFDPLFRTASEAGNSDFYPVLDLGAERTRFLRRRATGFGGLYTGAFDLTAPVGGRRLPAADVAAASIPEIPRLRALAIGAAVRAEGPAGVDSGPAGLTMAAAEQRMVIWDRQLEQAVPPPSWRVWLLQLVATDHDLHDGTSGVADQRFFAQAEAYAARHGAPEDVRAGIAFLRGLRTWNFADVAGAADRLLPAVLARQLPLDPDEFRDGAVLAKLQLGETADARRLMDTLATVATRAPDDVRVRLLDAYIRSAGGDQTRLGAVTR